ncbi:DUF4062 domain-containing protein [Streptococcaceae bacterium ESL0729]|nr:DUF4062 domain-containing protein [Streptococcaceae bacterium ESL0729]
MPKIFSEYNITLSCPNDIKDEKKVIESAVEDFNIYIGQTYNIRLRLSHWSTDAYPESGGEPQKLLNKQFIDDSDALICIFWSRFGTPTSSHESGTVEEFENAINSGKQVFIYFCDIPKKISKIDTQQLDKVNDFQRKIEKDKHIFYKSYESIEEFERYIKKDISSYFIKKNNLENDNSKN